MNLRRVVVGRRFASHSLIVPSAARVALVGGLLLTTVGFTSNILLSPNYAHVSTALAWPFVAAGVYGTFILSLRLAGRHEGPFRHHCFLAAGAWFAFYASLTLIDTPAPFWLRLSRTFVFLAPVFTSFALWYALEIEAYKARSEG